MAIAEHKPPKTTWLQHAGSGGEYALGVDSLPQLDVPQGALARRVLADSRIYPGTSHEYWVYVPAQYVADRPACVMVFQDGAGYADADGPVRAPTVFDNLIHAGEMPVTIGVFVEPGSLRHEHDQRTTQYATLSDAYGRFLLEEVLADVGSSYNLVGDAAGRAVCGMSDGGLCAFTVAWERPDAFSKAVSHVGSFTRLHGGSDYPYLIRRTRGAAKPIRVFLQDGRNDINIAEGDWPLANLSMASALMFARYDYRFEMGSGGHNLNHGGAVFPDTLRWLWRDYPGVAHPGTSLKAAAGVWDVVAEVGDEVRRSVLTITTKGGELAATLHDEQDGDIEVYTIALDGDVLSYDYAAPESQRNWGKGGLATMSAWVKVKDDAFQGALSSAMSVPPMDFSLEGRRRER